MKFHPLHDWVLVQMDELAKERNGIVLIEDSSSNTVRTGTVLQTGLGKHTKSGHRIPVGVEKGEKVAFFRWNMEHQNGKRVATVLEGMGHDIGLIRASDILFAFNEKDKVQIG